MQHPDSVKTYFALCDGDGTWNGEDYREKGWFTSSKPVKDEYGKLQDNDGTLQCNEDRISNFHFDIIGRTMENSVTQVRVVASYTLPPVTTEDENDDNLEGRKVTIILARPKTGRWHQVRQHLAGIGHAIIGDSSHGRSRTNRVWKKTRKLREERTCLHLCRIQLPATMHSPKIDTTCPLSSDLVEILQEMPALMDMARPILLKESVNVI